MWICNGSLKSFLLRISEMKPTLYERTRITEYDNESSADIVL